MTGDVGQWSRKKLEKLNNGFVEAMRAVHPQSETPIKAWRPKMVRVPLKKASPPTRAEVAVPLPEVPGTASIKSIARQVAHKHGLKIADLKSPRKYRDLSRARQEAFWRCYLELPHKSLPQIGRWFGGRDHSTVLHGYRQHERREQAKQAARSNGANPSSISTVRQHVIHKPPRWSRKDKPILELDCRSGQGTDDPAPAQVPPAGELGYPA